MTDILLMPVLPKSKKLRLVNENLEALSMSKVAFKNCLRFSVSPSILGDPSILRLVAIALSF